MAIKISGETVIDDSKKGLFNDVVVNGGSGESGEITLNCENNSHGVKLKGPAHSAGADYTLTLPDTSGNSGEVLTTDGTGAMSWAEVVGNEISTTAPTSPSVGALWTDTSEDPNSPILKTWNGSQWVTVGAALPSEYTGVINNVTLTENDPTGDRFTSQSFDVTIDMLREGAPFTQKGLKGEVTASFEQFPNSEPVASNAVTTFPNNSTSVFNQSRYNEGYARVYALDQFGRPQWYALQGDGAGNCSLRPSAPGQTTTTVTATYTYGYDVIYGAKYISTNETYDYIFTENNSGGVDNNCVSFRINKNAGTTWAQYYPGNKMSAPVYDSENNVWWLVRYIGGSDARIMKCTGDAPDDLNLGHQDESNLQTYSSGQIAIGNDRVVVHLYTNSNYHYFQSYARDAGLLNMVSGVNLIQYGTFYFLNFAGSYFWTQVGSDLYRSTDGINWTQTPVPISQVRLIHYNSGTGKYEAYGRSGDVTEMYSSNNAGVTWVSEYSYTRVSSNNDFDGVQVAGSLVRVYGWVSGLNGHWEYYNPYDAQVLTLSGTGADYSQFNVGDGIRPAGSTDPDERGVITNISGTNITITSSYVYQNGDIVEALAPTSSAVSTRFLVIDATGAVSGTVSSDPGYVSVGPNTSQTLTFPATFTSGAVPDVELPAGTTIKVSAQATNSVGSNEYGPSNVITPS